MLTRDKMEDMNISPLVKKRSESSDFGTKLIYRSDKLSFSSVIALAPYNMNLSQLVTLVVTQLRSGVYGFTVRLKRINGSYEK